MAKNDPYSNDDYMKEKSSVSETLEDGEPIYRATFDFHKSNSIKNVNGKKQLENKMRTDAVQMIDLFEKMFFPSWIQSYKDYTLSTLDRELDLQKKGLDFLTNEKQPIVRTFVDRLVQTLFSANFTTKTFPVNSKHVKKSKKVEAALAWAYTSSGAKKNVIDAGTEAILTGVGYLRSGFKTTKEKILDMRAGDPKVMEITEPAAKLDWVSIFNLFYEPFVPFYEQRRILYRKILPMKTIKKKLKTLNVRLTEDQRVSVGKSPYPFSGKDFDKIRLVKYWKDYAMNVENFQEDNMYQIKVDNDRCEYCEMWMGNNLLISVNGYLVYDGVNPRRNKGDDEVYHPFKILNFTRLPGVVISDGVGTMLAGQQRLYDALYNLTFDLNKFNAGPMFILKPGQTIEGVENVLRREPFTFKKVRGADSGSIESLEFPKPDPANAKTMSDILEMANFAIAPSTYNQVGGVSRSATDAQFRSEGLKDSVTALMQSINEMFASTYNDWISEMKAKMPREFKVMVLGDNGAQEFEEITQTDISGNYVYEVSSESIKEMNKIVDRTQFLDLMNIVKTIGQDPVTGKWLVSMEKLLANGMELFNQGGDMILNDKEYYQLLTTAQEKKMEIQCALQQFQQTLSCSQQQPEQGQFGDQGGQDPTNVGQVQNEQLPPQTAPQAKNIDVSALLGRS